MMNTTKLHSGNNETIHGEISKYFLNLPFFNNINSEEIKVIAKHMCLKQVKKDEILFTESEKGNYVCFITDGTLEVITENINHKEVILATLSKGELIGEMAIIEDLPRSATVRACTNSSLYILSKSAFDFIVSKHPHLGVKLLKGVSLFISQKLRKTSKELAQKSKE